MTDDISMSSPSQLNSNLIMKTTKSKQLFYLDLEENIDVNLFQVADRKT